MKEKSRSHTIFDSALAERLIYRKFCFNTELYEIQNCMHKFRKKQSFCSLSIAPKLRKQVQNYLFTKHFFEVSKIIQVKKCSKSHI